MCRVEAILKGRSSATLRCAVAAITAAVAALALPSWICLSWQDLA
jgi:hypothetical protein